MLPRIEVNVPTFPTSPDPMFTLELLKISGPRRTVEIELNAPIFVNIAATSQICIRGNSILIGEKINRLASRSLHIQSCFLQAKDVVKGARPEFCTLSQAHEKETCLLHWQRCSSLRSPRAELFPLPSEEPLGHIRFLSHSPGQGCMGRVGKESNELGEAQGWCI